MRAATSATPFPDDNSRVPRLLREFGPAKLKELILTGRAFDAEEALRDGFLNAVVEGDELLERATALAETIAARPRQAVLATKRGVDACSAPALQHAWSEPGVLAAALQDAEGKAARDAYMAKVLGASKA